MTGSLRHAPTGALADDPHRRAVVRLDDGSDVAYRDVRRFGTWLLLEPGELEPYLAARLGGEPLARAFTPKRLAARLANRRAPVKAALLDQRTVAGLGNIYVDEALWRARIHPLRRRASSTPDELGRLAPRDQARRSRRASRARARRSATTRSPDGGRGRMQERVQGLRPRGRAVRPLRHADREDRASPAAAPGTARPASASGREPLAEPAVAVEAPELGVAADRLAVDEDLRHRPAAGQVEQLLPEGRIVVERDLLVREPARARAAPSRGRSSRTSASCTSGSAPSTL